MKTGKTFKQWLAGSGEVGNFNFHSSVQPFKGFPHPVENHDERFERLGFRVTIGIESYAEPLAATLFTDQANIVRGVRINADNATVEIGPMYLEVEDKHLLEPLG